MLYKYLPRQHAETLADRGHVLFRSLSYFRRIEHDARGDEVEGVHVDAPDNDVALTVSGGPHVVGRFRFLNSVDQEKVYAFCCSDLLDKSLFTAFEADACVVIGDPETFFLRCQTAIRHAFVVDRSRLLHRSVAYWAPNRAAPLNVKDPSCIPFMKHEAFADQYEYRAVFALNGGRTLLQRIVQPQFTFADEIAQARLFERLLVLGDLRKLVAVVGAEEV